MTTKRRSAGDLAGLFAQPGTPPDRNEGPDPGLGTPPGADAGPDATVGTGTGLRAGARPGARAYTRPDAGPQAGVGPDPDAEAHAAALAAARRGLDLTARQYTRKLAELGQVRQRLTADAAALRELGEDEELVRARVLLAGAPPEALQ